MHLTLSKLKGYHRSLGLNMSLYHQDRERFLPPARSTLR